MLDFLQEAAWRFLIEEGINSLPVFPSRIIKRRGWRLYTYSEYAMMIQTSVELIIARYDKEAFVFWSNCENTFVICYNEAYSPDVIRWTLAHEIAHIVLGHISSLVPAMSRIRTAQRSLFEVEAQGFARRVLCPSIVLHACHAIEPEPIMRLCRVSREAAQYRSEHMKVLEARGKFCVHPLEREVEKQFQAFILCFLISPNKDLQQIKKTAQHCSAGRLSAKTTNENIALHLNYNTLGGLVARFRRNLFGRNQMQKMQIHFAIHLCLLP